MGDITNKRLLYVKGALLFALGGLAAGIALLLYPDWRLAALMAIAVWAFCRAYYFAFYVIEHYADPNYKFAGIGSFLRYLWRRRGEGDQAND
jgi:uncharacterized membrane protein YjjP (DUF1212 family)